jgi:Flp pilus assembly protein TadD
MGRLDEAVDEYLTLVASHPNDPNLLTKLAVFLLEDTDRRDPAAARRYAEEACRQTSYADPAILFALAQTLAAENDRARAMEVARRAGELASAAGNHDLSQAIEGWMARVGG